MEIMEEAKKCGQFKRVRGDKIPFRARNGQNSSDKFDSYYIICNTK